MSFRLFIYYSALVGAWMGACGWLLGRYLAPRLASDDLPILQDGFRGLAVGLTVALGLGTVDALWNIGWRRPLPFFAHLLVAVALGSVGGFAGGSLAQWLIGLLGNEWPVVLFYVLGWTLAGLFIGVSLASLDALIGVLLRRGRRLAISKTIKCAIGGAIGGLIGGLLSFFLREGWTELFSSKDPARLWSPTALGFVALGLSIGLLVGLAQVVLKQAWLHIETGFRPGREWILGKPTITLGRAESCDIGLFADPNVEKSHARITQSAGVYLIEDERTPAGTFLNNKRIETATPLRSGDLIRIGNNVLRFGERARRG